MSKKSKSEIIGETLLDLGKLTFAGIVLAGIFDADVNKYLLIFAGLSVCTFFVIAGIILMTKTKRRTKK